MKGADGEVMMSEVMKHPEKAAAATMPQDAEIEDDEARSEATFSFTVPNIRHLKDSILSPPCYVRNLPWKILVRQRQLRGPDGQQQKFLGFFLKCNDESESSSWSCYAKAELRLISHKPDTKPFYEEYQHLFNRKENDWGFPKFMAWSDVIDPEKGYIKDVAITLEVHVTAEGPYGVSWDSKEHTGYVESTTTMSSADETYTIKSPQLRELVKVLKSDEDDVSMRNRVSSYYVEGKIRPKDINVQVDGVGHITFPLKPETVGELKKMSSAAAFGKGEQTKLVRNTYVIPKDKLHVSIDDIEDILEDVKRKLGLSAHCSLEAHLHDMSVYEKGQHFDFHQDTEKMDNMVGTLVVALPSAHIGGDLVIKHSNETHIFSTETVSADSIKYLFDNYYTEYNFTFSSLRGFDRQVATALVAAAKELNLVVRLALADVLEVWHDEERYPPDSLYSLKARLESWRDENDKPLNYVTYRCSDSEPSIFLTSDDISTEASDFEICWSKHNEHFRPHRFGKGYTVNEGASQEKWYKRGALIMWPQSYDLKMRFRLNYDAEFEKLIALADSPNNVDEVKDIIEKIGHSLYDSRKPLKLFIKLALYINDPKTAFDICKKINELFKSGNSHLLCELKEAYGATWCFDLLDDRFQFMSREIFDERLIALIGIFKEQEDSDIIKQIFKHQTIQAGIDPDIESRVVKYGQLLQAAIDIRSYERLVEILSTVNMSERWDEHYLVKFYTILQGHETGQH